MTFNTNVVSYDKLVEKFWDISSPTTRNSPGGQYRNAIFYTTPEQKKAADESRARQELKLNRKITTEISPAAPWYRAEDYHQKYYDKTGISVCR